MSEYDAQWKLSEAMMELALGDGTTGERMDRIAPLILSLEVDDFPHGQRHRFISLREGLIRGDHLSSDEICLDMVRCLRELEGVLNPYEDSAK